jgi:hypothetical protein
MKGKPRNRPLWELTPDEQARERRRRSTQRDPADYYADHPDELEQLVISLRDTADRQDRDADQHPEGDGVLSAADLHAVASGLRREADELERLLVDLTGHGADG